MLSINNFHEEGRLVIHTDDICIYALHTTLYAWINDSLSGLLQKVFKEQCTITVHAGYEKAT